MTPESENFDQLKRLLALKRHEVPPPGYFNNFSRNVISRIRAGESAEPAISLSWLQRLIQAVEFKPAFAGAFGLAICALLAGGILYSAKMDDGTANANFMNNSFATLPTTPADNALAGNTPAAFNPLTGAPQPSSLFDPVLPGLPGLQQAGWRPFDQK